MKTWGLMIEWYPTDIALMDTKGINLAHHLRQYLKYPKSNLIHQGLLLFEHRGASADRRYLTMNNIGYTWVVQNKDTTDDATSGSGSGGNSITVSFSTDH